MKLKTTLLLASILLTATPAALRAQDYFTLSAGISLGTDGVGAELATQVGPHIQIRAGYGFAPDWPSFQVSELNIPEHPGAVGGEMQLVPLYTALRQNHGRLLVNVYPWAASNFFIAAGAYAGTPAYVTTSATNLPEDYNTAGIIIGDHNVKAHDGVIKGELRAWPVQPYLGVGIGRPVSNDRLVSFVAELGVRYMGTPALWTVGDSMTASKWIELPRSAVPEEYLGKYDTFSRLLSFYPTLSVRLYFNIL